MSTATQPNTSVALSPKMSKILADLNTPWKMRLYFLQKLPSLAFWSVKVKHCDAQQAQVTIPFRWRTQNPFRSTYFAALCGAAEFSTGLLALLAIGDQRVSMLIVNLEAEFIKKAVGLTTFTCKEGKDMQAIVQQALATKEPQKIKVTSVGTNADGEVVAKMTFTWSFKAKS